MGLDDPFHNFIKMIRSGIFVLAAIISALFLCHMIKKYKGNSVAVVFFAFIIGVIISLTFNVDLSDIGRPLPLLSLSALIFLVYLLKKSIQEDTITAINHIPVLLLNIFGFFLLFKMFFYSRMFHYGFYLTLPATLTLVCVLTWYLPKWFKTRYLGSEIFLVFVILVFVIFSIKFINVSDYYFRAKTFSVGAGKDRIVTYDPKYDSRTIPFSQAIAWIKANVAETDSLIVFPEGIMINFLTKRINPTPYINFMPPEMMIFGDNRILDAIKMNSPDYFVIVSRDTAEYGYDIFGRDKTLGNEIMNWVKEHYEQVVLFGHDPILKNRFGIKIMKHRN
jgi:hypothetical protein